MGGDHGGLLDMKGECCLLSADSTNGVVDQSMVFSSTLQPQQILPVLSQYKTESGSRDCTPISGL